MPHNRINMLQLVNGFAIGGGEKKLLELIERLDKDRYNVTVCSVGQSGPLEPEFRNVSQRLEVYPKKLSFDISLVPKVAHLMKDQQIDIVQTTLFYADVIGAYAACLAKVPIVISWETVDAPFPIHHYLSYKLALLKIDRVVAVSENIRQMVINSRGVAPEKVVTIHYGVDVKKYSPENQVLSKSALGIPEDYFVIGTVARFTDQKGHKYLIESAAEIVRNYPKVRFVLVGDGPLRQEIEQQLASLSLTEYFILLGFRKDVKQLLGIFDLFVLPSLYEGFPNAILEAMACARPIVATAVNGVKEVIDDSGTGYLIPSRNPVALTKAIINLLNSPHQMKEMGQRGRERILRHFSVEQQINKFDQLYQSLFQQKVGQGSDS